MKLSNLFTDHPSSVGESYWQHLRHASFFGWNLFIATCVVFIHALLPFIFVRTASRIIERLYAKMVANRIKR